MSKYLFCLQKALDNLADAIKTNNPNKATDWSRTPEWLTIEQFFQGKIYLLSKIIDFNLLI